MSFRNPQGEVDRVHDAICPIDFDWSEAHAITDTDFNDLFDSVPQGVEFVWISDSCHSGHLITKEPPKMDIRRKTIVPPADMEWRIQVAREKGIHSLGFTRASSKLNLALIAGCKSDQTSADASFNGRANGALTFYLLKELGTQVGLKEPLTKVIKDVQASLGKNGYDQVPQLEGSPVIEARGFLAQNSSAVQINPLW